MHNIIAQIKYDNNIPDKIWILVHKDKRLDGDAIISETGLVNESSLQLHMLDEEWMGSRPKDKNEINDEG